ncbi:MAG: hypothetical protein K0Q87_152 [Neobacillus sp.]|jgi:uncharacterized damage-inducible protein DinB|nr:hypothetical protein [Neobacillus sp.]
MVKERVRLDEKRKSPKKTIYVTKNIESFMESYAYEGESMGKVFNRVCLEYPTLLKKAKANDELNYELRTMRKMLNELLSQHRIFLDVLNTTIHDDDYATLFSVEENPEDIILQAIEEEKRRNKKSWVKTHNQLHAPGFSE